MYHETHPDVLRLLATERQERLRHEAAMFRLRRRTAPVATQRRRRRAERARAHHPHLVAPPPALTE